MIKIDKPMAGHTGVEVATRFRVRVMPITLDQAIEIHAKALRYRHGAKASRMAREKADQLATIGDREGFSVWLKVAEMTEALLVEMPAR